MESEARTVLIISLPAAEEAEDGKKHWELLATSTIPGVLPALSEPQQRVHNEHDTRGLLPLPVPQVPNVGSWRRRTSRRKFRIFFSLSVLFFVGCVAWFKSPPLMPDKPRQDDRDDDHDVLQPFELIYKYADVAGVDTNHTVSNSVETLFARDLARNRNRFFRPKSKGVVRSLASVSSREQPFAAVSRLSNATAIFRINNAPPDG